MKLEELLRHVADNVEAGRSAGHGLLYKKGFEDEEKAYGIFWNDPEGYELANRTHTVNGFEVPSPESEGLCDGQVYFHPSHELREGFYKNKWFGESDDFSLLKNKQVFLTKEAAIANQKAQAFIDPNK